MYPESATDDELISQLQQPRSTDAMRQAALGELYRRWSRRVLATVGRIVTTDEALDVTQTFWMRLPKIAGQYKAGKFGSWLLTVAANQARDALRKRKPAPLETQPIADPRGDAVEPILARERVEIFQGCLMKLDPKLRELVVGRMGGETYEDLSERLAITMEQIYKRFHAAKTALTECVQKAES